MAAYTRTVAGLISRFSSSSTLGAPVFDATHWTGGTGLTITVVSNELRIAYSSSNPNQNRVARLDASPSQAKRMIHALTNGSQGFLCGPAAHVSDIVSTTADYVAFQIYSAASGTDGPYLREVTNGTGSTFVDQAVGAGTSDETSALFVNGTAVVGFHHDAAVSGTNPCSGTAASHSTGQAGLGFQSGGAETATVEAWIESKDRYCTISGLQANAATAELRTSADVLICGPTAVVAGSVTFDMMLMHVFSAIALNKLIVRDGAAAAITALGNDLTNDIYVGGDTYHATSVPVVTITAPADASEYTEGDNIHFIGTAIDVEDGDISAGIGWSSDLDGALGSGDEIVIADLSVGTHVITASRTDSDGLTGTDTITVIIEAAVAPVVTIDAPADGSDYAEGQTVSFEGTATDADDGDLSASIEWSSDVDGVLGTGATLDISTLSAGTHVITASVTDSDDLTATDTITITVVFASFEVAAFNSPCDPLVVISWTPFGTAYTIKIYAEEASDPGNWVLVQENIPGQLGVYGWQFTAPGTYRFRVELYLDGVLQATAYTNSITSGRSRVLTEEMRTLLGARQRQDRIWVFVEDADGVPRDRSDYLTGCEVSGHRDQHVTSASVQIRREHGSLSLAPELDASPLNRTASGTYGPAIAIGRRFTIWTAPVAADGPEPEFEDAFVIFCGRIDEHDFSSSDASFSGRDHHGRLADTWIEEARNYGAPEPGVPMQEVIQQIFDDNAPLTGIYVPEDIDVEFGAFKQETALLLETGRSLALLGGADLRGLWEDESGTFPLWLYQPDRLTTTPSYVFSRDEWLAVTAYRLAIANIANVVAGGFLDDNNVQYFIDPPYSDPASIAKYGRRWMEFDLKEDSPIRTAAAFEALALAALQDLSEPDAEMEIRTVFFWPAGINRFYGFQADGIRFAEQRNFACVGYRHVYRKGSMPSHMEDTWETYLTVRGQPAAALEEYLTKGKASGAPSRPPGVPIPPATPSPPDPTAMRISFASASNTPGAVYYDDPPALVTAYWTVENPTVGPTISVDRQVDTEGWELDRASGLALAVTEHADSVADFENRPSGSPPPIVSTVMYRIRVMDGATVLLSRTTNSVPIHPA